LIVTGLLSWLTKRLSWFGGLSWPEAIFLAFWMALAAVFFCAASLALYRQFRPLPASALPPPELDYLPVPHDNSQLPAELTDALEAFDGRIDGVSAAVAAQATELAGAVSALNGRLDQVTERLAQPEPAGRAYGERMKSFTALAVVQAHMIRGEAIAPTVAELEKQYNAKPFSPRQWPRPPQTAADHFIRIFAGTLGLDVQPLMETLARRVDEIKMDAKYLAFEEGDAAIFKDGEDKRDWHIFRARVRAQLNWLKGYQIDKTEIVNIASPALNDAKLFEV
jgi:hypothetical protein